MLTRRLLLTGAGIGIMGLWPALRPRYARAEAAYPFVLSDAEWKARLTEGQYAVLRQDATETPYSSPLLHESRTGVFTCAGCDQPAFSSETKYDSGTGWPSFWAPLDTAVGTARDTSLGAVRTSVHCSNCGGHFGHVFDDGPKPSGLRYCMNGLALGFRPKG